MIHDYGQHFIFPGCNDDTTVKKIMATVQDVTDQAIYNAIIKEAQDAGVTDLYLMDKKFVFDALREKLEREKPKPLTMEEVLQMGGCPLYVVPLNARYHHLEGWHIMYDDCSGAAAPSVEYWGWIPEDYGETWIAYRHKPKEDVK